MSDLTKMVEAGAILYGLYLLVPLVIAILCVPGFMNLFNGSGYWYNALCCLGLSGWLHRRTMGKFQRESDERFSKWLKTGEGQAWLEERLHDDQNVV